MIAPTPSPSGQADRTPSTDNGPARFHRLHGSVPLGLGRELRITTQAARGIDRPARLVIRPWREKNGNWWPVAQDEGVTVEARDLLAFSRAVANAVLSLRPYSRPSPEVAPHKSGDDDEAP